jgi:CBS domain-containing protein
MTDDPLLVSYDTGRWTLVRKSTLQNALRSGQGGLPLREVLPGARLPRLHPDQPLDVPLRLLRDAPFLPVVHRADARRLIGILSIEDILAAYRRASAVNAGFGG